MLEKIKGFLGITNKIDFTVIGKSTTITGNISCDDIYIEGEVSLNEASTFKNVKILPDGSLNYNNCTCYTNNIDIAGTFTGNIVCDNIHIHNGAKVKGTILYSNTFSSDKNVNIDATIKRKTEV